MLINPRKTVLHYNSAQAKDESLDVESVETVSQKRLKSPDTMSQKTLKSSETKSQKNTEAS